jgi:hypothetical protein
MSLPPEPEHDWEDEGSDELDVGAIFSQEQFSGGSPGRPVHPSAVGAHDVGTGVNSYNGAPIDPSVPDKVPMFADAKPSYLLRVSRRTPQGVTELLGTLPHTANEETVIAEWPRPGTFVVDCIDSGSGKAVHPQRSFTVGPDHMVLRRLRENAATNHPAAQAGASGGYQGLTADELQKIVAQSTTPILEAVRRREEQLEAERERVAAEKADAARQREEAVSTHQQASMLLQDRVSESMQKVLEFQSQSAEQSKASLGEGFAGLIAMMQSQAASQAEQIRQAAESERARMLAESERRAAEERDRREREQRDHDMRLQLERERMQAEREEMRLRYEADRKAAEEAHNYRIKQAEVQLQRERDQMEKRAQMEADHRARVEAREAQERRDAEERRIRLEAEDRAERRARERERMEFQERMEAKLADVKTSQDPLNNLGNIAAQAAKIAGMFGVSMPDVVSKMFDGQKQAGIMGLVQEGLVTLRELAKAQAAQADEYEDGEEDDPDDPLVTVPTQDGQTVQMRKSEYDQLVAQMRMGMAEHGTATAGGPQAALADPRQATQQPWATNFQPGNTSAQPQPVQQGQLMQSVPPSVPPQSPAPQPPTAPAGPPPSLAPDQPANMTNEQLVKCRQASIRMIETFRTSQDESAWLNVIVAEFGKVDSLGEYLAHNSVDGALQFHGADSDLRRKVITALEGYASMLPNGIRLTRG